MHFTTASLVSFGLAAVHALPLTSTVSSGCRMDLAPTLTQPQNAASNILYHTLSKWASATDSSYASSNYLDTQNTVKAPYSVTFKADTIPDFQSTGSISAVLDTWIGTYLIGGNSSAKDDYAITGVTCF
ncbi:hypothetical protein F4777DRAFT_566128 [Nemania sp. FL0916]|nr:hypothetical protein F4777DRAFT_566128 [Nemania sp. FL0916]